MVLWFIVDTSDTRRHHSLHCGVTKVRLFDPCAILRKERVTQGSPLVRIDSTELPDGFKLQLAPNQYGRTKTEDQPSAGHLGLCGVHWNLGIPKDHRKEIRVLYMEIYGGNDSANEDERSRKRFQEHSR